MKRLLLLSFIITICVIIYNCDDAGVKPEDTSTQVSGTVTNWGTLGSKILKAIVKDSSQTNIFLADSTTINGSFTAKLKVPPDNFIWTYYVPDPAGHTCNGTINISPVNLKNATLTFDVYDASNNRIGSLQKKNFAGPVPTSGSFIASYFYFNNTASILGTRTCTSSLDTIIVNCNYNGNKGWDPVITLWNTFTATRQDIQISIAEPPGALWYYIP